MAHGRDTKGRYKKGEAPGKPKGAVTTDKGIAIKAIFQMFSESENQKIFNEKLQEAFKKNPLAFYKTFIEPLQIDTTTPEDTNEIIIRVGK